MYLKNDLRFVATFRYELESKFTGGKPPYIDGFTFSNHGVGWGTNSICNETLVGFVSDTSKTGTMEEHPITCFFAEIDKRRNYTQ